MEDLLADGGLFIDQCSSYALDARGRADDAKRAGEDEAADESQKRKSAARGRLANQQVKMALKEMGHLRALVDKALELPGAGAGDPEGVSAIHERITAWRDSDIAYEILGDRDREAERAQREEGRGGALAAAEDLAAIGALKDDPALPHADSEKLAGVVAALREMEGEVAFQARMRQQTAAAASASGYSEENFAYGSTPYRSWAKVFALPQLRDAVRAARGEGSEGAGKYMVWGSSTGWLVFYGALTFGIPSVGHELLECHVETSKFLAAAHGVGGASFVAGDMLESDLGGVAVLMLASQCWDRDLQGRAAEKIRAELPAGAVVVDYSSAICGMCGAEPVAQVEVPVSWNPAIGMCIFSL